VLRTKKITKTLPFFWLAEQLQSGLQYLYFRYRARCKNGLKAIRQEDIISEMA
jgi:hypothetical protein